jgi:polyhydroxybutyrate depolymerase
MIIVHGYGATGAIQQEYLGFGRLVEDADVLLLAPDGLPDLSDLQRWDYLGASDDVTYLGDLIDEVSAVYNVDADRVVMFGHSNGGFMVYRMACERSDAISAVVALAGNVTENDPCTPERPVSVLHIHGDQDTAVAYEGTQIYLGAAASVARWAELDGCTGGLQADSDPLDLDEEVDGAETQVERATGCPKSIGAELWSLIDGDHVPTFHPEFPDIVWSWYDAHTP